MSTKSGNPIDTIVAGLSLLPLWDNAEPMNGEPNRRYFRPVPCDRNLSGGYTLAGTSIGFREIEVLSRNDGSQVLPADAVMAMFPEASQTFAALTKDRPSHSGIAFSSPNLMGIVNATPDSFSDGGQYASVPHAIDHAMAMAQSGADILDIGGESTRPGAEPVTEQEEADRVLPVIEGLVAAGVSVPISIDTRNGSVARQALAAGARILNDVSALSHDPASLDAAKDAQLVCLMHAQGDPQTMQHNPEYENVLLDVFDYLEYRISVCEMAGVPRERLIVDPGIGFGKTIAHNLALIRGLALFHGLGCPVLLGASRKGFIGKLGGEPEASRRAPGSIAAALAGLASGVQVLRVHDVSETAQAVRIWQAIDQGEAQG